MTGKVESKTRGRRGVLLLLAAGAVLTVSVTLITTLSSTKSPGTVVQKMPAAPVRAVPTARTAQQPPPHAAVIISGESGVERKAPARSGKVFYAKNVEVTAPRPLLQPRMGLQQPQSPECIMEAHPPLAKLGMPLPAPSGEGLDVATLKPACDKDAPADLSERLSIKNPGAAPKAKSRDGGDGLKASIGGYQGRLSERQFTVNIGSTFR